MQKSLPLAQAYEKLFAQFGPQQWWPGYSRIETIVGAILTQNTSWKNVEKALANLKEHEALNLQRLYDAPEATLAKWIRPAGYFNVKAKRLKAFMALVVEHYRGDLDVLFQLETSELREVLLAVNGIGPETADCILLYAAERPVFVVDAYTRRFMSRHGWLGEAATYDEVALLFQEQLPSDTALFNEYHALIVNLGKDLCRKQPQCDPCPLRDMLPRNGPYAP